MFACVGCLILSWCSLCCFCICLFILASHHDFLLCFGIFSCFSITRWIASCISLKCCGVVFVCVVVRVVIAFFISLRMIFFLLLYCRVESVGFFVFFC